MRRGLRERAARTGKVSQRTGRKYRPRAKAGPSAFRQTWDNAWPRGARKADWAYKG